MLLENEVGVDFNKCLSAVMYITNDKVYIDYFDDSATREYHKDLAVLLVERGADARKIAGGRYGKELAVKLTDSSRGIAALYGIAIKEKDKKHISLIMETAIHNKEILEIIKEATNKKCSVSFVYCC